MKPIIKLTPQPGDRGYAKPDKAVSANEATINPTPSKFGPDTHALAERIVESLQCLFPGAIRLDERAKAVALVKEILDETKP